MAKLITLTPDKLDEIRKEFNSALNKAKMSDGKITYTKFFGSIQRKATVYFTALAWKKMQTLIKECDKEVGWHGIAYRSDDPEKDEYLISDILVYPQVVTGSTVTTDQSKYQDWLMDHDDEVFNNIRMQGHSHVNFGVTPSGVDTSLYERILDQLDDTMFYIFLIYNKKGEKTFLIYDMAKNVLFETADVTVKVVDSISDPVEITGCADEDERKAVQSFIRDYRLQKSMGSFLEDAKKMVVNKTYQPTTYNYGAGYYGSMYGKSAAASPAAPAASPAKPAEPAKTAPSKPEVSQPVKKNGSSASSTSSVKPSEKKRKGHRKGSKSRKQSTMPLPRASVLYDDYDDYDDPYGDSLYGYGRY